MPRKTITDTAIEVLAENGRENIWWGDQPMLDEIAARATHTNLLSLNPLLRHSRILDALERSGKFKKGYITLGGMRGNNKTRCMTLKPQMVENREMD